MKKVSVIIPVYNRAYCAAQSISSVLAQDYPNFEVLVIDDGSSDALLEVIDSLNSEKIRYYRTNRNRGQSYARNMGVFLSEGDIVAFQDSDDIWVQGRMKKQLEQMEGFDFSFCSFIKNGIITPSEEIDCSNLFSLLLRTPLIGTPTLFCKKSVFESIGGFNETYRCFEDYDLSLRLSKYHKGVFINEPLVIAKDSVTHVGEDGNANEGLRVRCDIFQKYYSYIAKYNLQDIWLKGIQRFKGYCDDPVFDYEIGKLDSFLREIVYDPKFINTDDRRFTRELFTNAIDIGLDFKLNAPALGDSTHTIFLPRISQNGISNHQLLSLFQNTILPACTNFSSVNFLGFPDAGNSISGVLGAILGDIVHQNLINESFCAPIATQMEIEVLQTLRRLAGYSVLDHIDRIEQVGSIITYGGTGSNCTAMLLAREHKTKDTMTTGITDTSKYYVLVPKGIGHYSIRSSLKWIGCGDHIIEVETEGYRYSLPALSSILDQYAGRIMAVVAYAGDSRTMTIDYLDRIESLVHEKDPTIWCHVDACHGFSMLFSEDLKKKLAGINKYDSISCDPHKVLAIPYPCSALLLKDPAYFDTILSNSDLIMNENLAFGKITPFIGSKSWISLKLWFILQNLGINGVGEMISKRHQMAQQFKKALLNTNCFYILNEVNFNSVVFIWHGGKDLSIEQMNNISKKMYKIIKQERKYYYHQFPILIDVDNPFRGKICYPLRYMSGNDNLTIADLQKTINYLLALGEKCYYDNGD